METPDNPRNRGIFATETGTETEGQVSHLVRQCKLVWKEWEPTENGPQRFSHQQRGVHSCGRAAPGPTPGLQCWGLQGSPARPLTAAALRALPLGAAPRPCRGSPAAERPGLHQPGVGAAPSGHVAAKAKGLRGTACTTLALGGGTPGGMCWAKIKYFHLLGRKQTLRATPELGQMHKQVELGFDLVILPDLVAWPSSASPGSGPLT